MNRYLAFPLLVCCLMGCSLTGTDTIEPLDLALDGRTSLDVNGYYHLTLDSTRNQTPHRVSGTVFNQVHITKVDWESNLTWYLNGEAVPTINKASYSNEQGEVNVMIAPIYKMKGDTMVITGTIAETNESETIKFLLE